MGSTEKLIKQFAQQGHPLGRGISEGEVPELVESLRQRFGTSANELDLSEASIKRLERWLIDLHQSMREHEQGFSEQELVLLMREIAAYLGQVLVMHTGGQWRNMGSLYGTEIVYEEPWKVIKGRDMHTSSKGPVYSMGGEAAWAWDALIEGRKPNLYRLCQESREKQIREQLKSVRK
jgi:hypothetical protein